MELSLVQIAHIETPFPEKFGVPRQSGLCEHIRGRIVFEPEFRDVNSLRFLETYSHVWLIWGFSAVFGREWSPTVRPPKMGGNERAGVFATRSPFRPNPLAISCVKLESIEHCEDGPVINVSGVDMVNGTPIYDIKPYVPYTDCVPGALPGISSDPQKCSAEVVFECEIDKDLKEVLEEVLGQDPHPLYINDSSRIYKMSFKEFTVSFKACNGRITVTEVR